MLKLNQLSVAIVLISLASGAQSATVTPTYPDATTVEYSNGTHNTIINEQASTHTTLNVNNVQINGFESNLDFTSPSFPLKSVISLGGNNGYLGNNLFPDSDANYERYDSLTINVDADTVITAILNGELTGIYSRTDANGALTQVNNDGTINITSTGAGIIRGILAENLGTSTGGNGGQNNQLGGDVSVNLGATSNITLQGDGGIYGLLAIGNNSTVNSAEGSQITLNGTASSTWLLGIATKAYFGTAVVDNAGDITINGASSTAANEIKGIVASESRHSDITNSGNINVTGINGVGIHSNVTLNSMVANSGNIDVIGDNSTGIYSASRFGNANIALDNALSHVDVSSQSAGSSATGISAASTEAGSATFINIGNADYIKAESTNGNATAVIAKSSNATGASDATIDIDNIREITASGNDGVYAVQARAINGNATINIGSNVDLIQSLASNATSGNSNEGVFAFTDKGDATITSHAKNIYVTGQNNDGIIASSGNGNATVTATGTIKTAFSLVTNSAMFGIVAQSFGNAYKATIDYTGCNTTFIETNAIRSSALYANARDGSSADVTARHAQLITTGRQSHGIESVSSAGTNAGTSKVDFSGAISASGSDSSGVHSTTVNGANTVTIQNNSSVKGGEGANTILASGISMTSNGIAADAQTLNIGAGSVISATNDSAIYASTTGDATTTNNGAVIGYTTYVGSNTTFNNNASGRLELKDFGTLGTTKSAMITSNFGTNGVFNNKGSIAFASQNDDGTATHAQFTNVATFDHSGVIDLRTNGYTGNTINITNGGNGNFISNGGSLLLNTQVSAPTGPSDKLIVDDVTTGTGGATKIHVTPTAGSVYGYLQGDGIQLVQVNGSSTSNAFTLGSPVINGIYQYKLEQGDAANTDSWYLRNAPDRNGGAAFNPSIGGYLANMSAATTMFTHTLRDRPLEGEAGALNDTSKFYSLWLRTRISHGSYRSANESLSNKNKTYLLQMGSDIGVWKLNNGNLHVGVMGGYSDYENTTTSRATDAKAESTMKGYNVGAYATWFQNDDGDLGLYVDTWSQYSWFRNHVSGKGAIAGSKSYDSNVWSNSVEMGYGLALGADKGYEWIVTPQAQLTYNLYNAKNQYDDSTSLSVTNNKANGLVSRVGARIHARGVNNKPAVQPYLELNWLNTIAKNQANFNGTRLKNGAPRDLLEAKVGIQGNLSEKLSISAQIGGQWGKNQFKQHSGQLNLTYRF